MGSKDYFEKVAENWDSMRQSFFTVAVRDEAFKKAGIIAGQIAADIGAGTGFVTEGLISHGLRVIAVDESEAMLSQMKKRFAGFNSIEYRIGESEALPLDTASVDYVFANMYLHHVESPGTAIKEMTRILKPKGKLVITDLDEHQFLFLKTEHHDRWMGFNRKDIKEWLIDAGLTDVVVDCIGQNCCTQSICSNEKAAISIFVASGNKA
ncbi:class I SAM-dependent methyltransferase [Thermotalea metallivorans]|uniref:Putative methyltransferase n=1 Tax=Thermotalea metallivorans TaxID=520762 RepID=A0A140L052_9FIRM|nr:class I SAM-dependent methyltransferase [Thermotalea metallivorans]KXG73927.1 putative methyltransferase [Thermotalea metallivorans]